MALKDAQVEDRHPQPTPQVKEVQHAHTCEHFAVKILDKTLSDHDIEDMVCTRHARVLQSVCVSAQLSRLKLGLVVAHARRRSLGVPRPGGVRPH